MRLIKLLAYSLLGYVIYELYLGMTEGCESRSVASSQSGGVGRSEGVKPAGRKVGVEEANGARRTRSVGRGVVH
jgi:hypothetical protein